MIDRDYTFSIFDQDQKGSRGKSANHFQRVPIHLWVEHNEIFVPVSLDTVHIFLGFAAYCDLHCDQTNVTIAFLNGDLVEEIYM